MKIASILTPLTAAALLLPAAALLPNAAQAEPMTFSVGGYFTQSLQLVDIDDYDDITFEDEVLAQNAEIHFKGKTMLSNGTELGIRIELEASDAEDQIDEHYLYMKGDWGKLIVGAENGIGHLMQVRAPRFVPGLKMFDNSLTEDTYETAFDRHLADEAIEDAHMSTKLEHISGDANKLSYMTPSVGGLQIGFSFAPNNDDRYGGEQNAVASNEGGTVDDQPNEEDIIELGVSYKGSINDVGYKFSYTEVEGDTRVNDNKPESTSVGLALQYGDWVLGGNMSEYKHLNEVDSRYANSESIETTSYALKYRLNKDSYVGIGFTDCEEMRHEPRTSGIVENGNLGDGNEIGGTADNADSDIPAITFEGSLMTTYEEMMIGGGTKLGSGLSLGFYYTIAEAAHQTVSGGVVTPPVAVASADDTPGSISDYEVSEDDTEISAVGITLALRF